MFVKEPNIDLLLRLIDLPTNPAGSNELLLTLIRRGDASTLCQTGTFRKLMRFAKTNAIADSESEIKPEFLKRFPSMPAISKHLSPDTFIELLAGLTAVEFDRSLAATIGQSGLALWILEVDNFRPFLDWAKGLSATSRDTFVIRLGKLIETNHGAADRALNDPSTLEDYWLLVGAIADEDAKRSTLFMLAKILASEPHFRSDARKELVQLILATQTPAADAALNSLLRNSHYRERIFDQGDDVKAHLNRCARFDLATGEKSLIEAYQNTLLADALRQYMAAPSNSHWILKEYLPSLSDPKRKVAIVAMCNSERLLQTWKETPAIEQLLELATEQVDPITGLRKHSRLGSFV